MRGSGLGVGGQIEFWTGAEDEVFERLMQSSIIAVDTESDPFHRFFERVCLVQFSTNEEDLIFDPLEAGTPLPSGVVRVLTGEGPRLVLHGGESDVRALKQSFGLKLGPLFDTQVAAQFLGKEKTGLKDLLSVELGVDVDKGEQRSDWGARPLSDKQIAYARQDTQHLLQLWERLFEQLVARGRAHWHEEECLSLREAEPTVKRFDPQSWRKIKGSRVLRARGRRVLAAAVAWRDAEARAEDRPAFRIVRSDLLLRVAKRVDEVGEKSLSELMNGRHMPTGQGRMRLERAIREGLDGPDPGKNRPPRPPAERKEQKSAESKAKIEELKRCRQGWSADLGLDPGFLLPGALLERLAAADPRDSAALMSIDGFSVWRDEALGKHILNALSLMDSPKRC